MPVVRPGSAGGQETTLETEGRERYLFHRLPGHQGGEREEEDMNILAIDTGTKTGWAIDCNGMEESGVQDFSLKRGESAGMRFFNFRVWLERMLNKFPVKLVVYEQSHHRGGAATMVSVGMTTRIQEICEIRDVKYTPVHSATLKKFATGKGNAPKERMLELAIETWGAQIIDDNEADARWLLYYAQKEICNVKET